MEYQLERTLEGHQRWVWDAAFSADSAYLVTGRFCTIATVALFSVDQTLTVLSAEQVARCLVDCQSIYKTKDSSATHLVSGLSRHLVHYAMHGLAHGMSRGPL
jgi:WD40 repeat protein